MQILFIWFKKYKGLRNFQTNIGGNFTFYFDNEDMLTVRDNDLHMQGFFKNSIKNNEIHSLNISAMVGENGSGKSTILDFLIQLILDENMSDYIIVYSQYGKIYKDYRFLNTLHIQDQTRGNINIATKNFYDPKHLTIFFSNVFDVRYLNSNFSNDSEEFINISTNALLSRHENVKDFMYEELQRQIFFINKHNKNFMINQVIELPTKIKIEISNDIKFDEVSSELYFYDDFKIFKSNNLSKSKRFKKEFQLKFVSSYISEVKNVLFDTRFNINDKEFFEIINTSLNLAKNEKDFFSIFMMKLNEIAINLYTELKFIEKISELSSEYLKLYNSFSNLEVKIYENYDFDNVTGEEILNEYIEIDSTLSRSEKFIELYINEFSTSDFLKFSWIEMSSGQFSFLTLFSRFSYIVEQLSNERKYSSYLLLIDEGDLYFHPQLQKDWLFHFIKIIDTIFSGSVQVILTTHSPFVLSDMPNTNVTFLTKESKINQHFMGGLEGSPRTFAANISELLSNSFFIKEGLIGQFAKEKINESIRWILTSSPSEVYKEREELLKFIDLIGEPILRNKVYDVYLSKLKLFEAQDLKEIINLFELKMNELKKLSSEKQND